MSKRIQILAAFFVLCFGLLFLQLNNLHIRQATALRTSIHAPTQPGNTDSFEQPRGDILSSNGVVLAYSTPTKDGYGEYRHYPLGSLFADITGYYDVAQSSAPDGLEDYYNNYLSKHESAGNTLQQLLTQQSGTDNVVTTVSTSLQQVAAQALQPYSTGGVVVIDPRTGAILAMYGKPTYDPNGFSSHDLATVERYYESLDPDSGTSPLIDFPTQHFEPPGSTFKVVTTTAMYDHDPNFASEVFPVKSFITLPDTNKTLSNYAGELCGGNLANIFANSCDTSYADLGLQIGGTNLATTAKAFGFNQSVPIDLPSYEVSPSVFPPPSTLNANPPFLAYSSIGQFNVEETVLQDALIAAGIANNGVIMTPHLMRDIVNGEGSVVTTYHPHPWLTATSSATATQVRSLMRGVVEFGTASGVGFPPQDNVAAKTGTAETGTGGCSSDWLIAMAPAGPGQTPSVAVAAVVPAAANAGCSETGALVAGPIVEKVLTAALAMTH